MEFNNKTELAAYIQTNVIDLQREIEKLEELTGIAAKRKELKTAKAAIKAHLEKENIESFSFRGTVLAWFKERVNFDVTRFKKEHPDLAKEYPKETHVLTFAD